MEGKAGNRKGDAAADTISNLVLLRAILIVLMSAAKLHMNQALASATQPWTGRGLLHYIFCLSPSNIFWSASVRHDRPDLISWGSSQRSLIFLYMGDNRFQRSGFLHPSSTARRIRGRLLPGHLHLTLWFPALSRWVISY
jgi:hypothetical protein